MSQRTSIVSLLLCSGALIGLAACDSTEPEPEGIRVVAHPDTIAFYYEDGYEIRTRDWFSVGTPTFISLKVEMSDPALAWDASTNSLSASAPTDDIVRFTASAEGYRDTTLSLPVVAAPYRSPIRVRAHPDTLEVYRGETYQIVPSDWFESEVIVSVRAEVDGSIWAWQPDARQLEALATGTQPIRIVGSAPQREDVVVTVEGNVLGHCPPTSDLDDFFPVEDGKAWAFDFNRHRIWNDEHERTEGVMTVQFASISCHRGVRTIQITRELVGTKTTTNLRGTWEESIYYTYNPETLSESVFGQIEFNGEGPFYLGGVQRYQSGSQGDLEPSDLTPSVRRRTTLRAGVGVVQVTNAEYGFRTNGTTETWTRR